MKSKKVSLIIIFAVFIGIVVGLVISSNLDWTNKSIAANQESVQPILLGAQDQEPLSDEVVGLQSLSKAFARVANHVKPSVVTIRSTQTVQVNAPDIWRYFFNLPEEDVRQGLGSGVIVNPKGYIITNNHVVENSDELQVTIGKEVYDAEIVGRDKGSDLAVIKIEAEDLPAIKFGSSSELEVGEWVLAIGNPFSELLDQTVTAGIVSAKGRSNLTGGQITFEDFIQTDAAINPGNSGGALVNLKGELIGINTMIYSGSGGNVGIGFAIPVDLAENVMQQLIDTGKVSRGWLGVIIGSLDEDTAEAFGLDSPKGALVNEVTKDSPAEKAGVQEGDIITYVNGREIEDSSDLVNMIASLAPNTKVDVTVWRDNRDKNIEIKLGERPGEEDLVRDSVSENKNLLGLKVENLTSENKRQFGYEDEEGVLIVDIERGSVAEKERLRKGDLVISVNRKKVTSTKEFYDILDKVEPNDVVLFRLKRGGTSYFAAVRVPKEKD